VLDTDMVFAESSCEKGRKNITKFGRFVNTS